MANTSVVTARLDPETMSALEKLAASRERSKAWIVAKAVRQYVEDEAAFHAFLEAGDAAIDRGDYLTQEQMIEWARSLDRDRSDA